MARPDTMIIRAGMVIDESWVTLQDEAPPPAGDVIVSADRLTLDEGALKGRAGRLGVDLPPATVLDAIARFLPDLALAVVSFPAFRDGRGFSLARALRERHGFAGEIRARGHILPDQYLFLTRCGVDTVELPACADIVAWRRALGQFSIAYQAGADPTRLSPLRRTLTAV